MSRADFQRLEQIGISGLGHQWLDNVALQRIAMDSAMTTTPSNGIPAYLTQYTSPNLIKILTGPLAAEEIFRPKRVGQYGTMSAVFPVIEHTGAIGTYADYGNDGHAGYNTNWPGRDAFYFQTITTWGDLEQAVQSYGGINAAMEKREAAARVLKMAHNKFWFFGVENLRNWGILNDPRLNPAVPPKPNAGGDLDWESKSSEEIFDDVRFLFMVLSRQNAGLVDQKAVMQMTFSTESANQLTKKNSFGISVKQSIAETYPNLSYVTAPEMTTDAGELVMLSVPSLMGQSTGDLGYVELMKAHGPVRELSAVREKNSAATFGAIFYQPSAIATMLGV